MTKVSIAQFTSGGTKKGIDEIHSANELDLILNPTGAVKVPYFSGEFALVSGTLKEIEESVTTKTEISYVSGVTSSIQDQIDNFDASPLTTKGDIYIFDTANNRLPIGTAGQVLVVDLAEASGLKWVDPPSTSPTTTEGDLIIRGASEDIRLARGLEGQVPTVEGNTLVYKDPVAGDVSNLIINPDFSKDGDDWTITETDCPATYATDGITFTCTAGTFSLKQNVDLSAYKVGEGLSNILTYSSDIIGASWSPLSNDVRQFDLAFSGDGDLQTTSLVSNTTDAVTNGIEVFADSAITGVIFVSNVKMKIEDITYKTSGAHSVGFIEWAATGSCFWTRANVAIGDFASVAACDDLTRTSDGLVDSGLGLLPQFDISSARTDGSYSISATGAFYENTLTATQCTYYFDYEDGITSGQSTSNSSTLFIVPNLQNTFKFSSAGNKTIKVQAKSDTGNNCIIDSRTAGLKFTVHFYPDAKSTVVSQNAELTAETANVLSLSFNYTASASSSLDDIYDVVTSITDVGSSTITVNIESSLFTTKPKVDCEPHDASGDIGELLTYNIGTSAFSIQSYNHAGAAQAFSGDIDCDITKAKVDTNKSITVNGVFNETSINKNEDKYNEDEVEWGFWNGNQLYKRCYTVASDITSGTTTIETWATGLKPINAIQFTGTDLWLLHNANFDGSNVSRIRYNDSTGVVEGRATSYKVGAGTTGCMEYTK